MLSSLKKYQNENLYNPEYLFHGSPKDLSKLAPNTSYDSANEKNADTAIFTTSSILIAAAYAFKDKIKELNSDKEWDFKITSIESNIIMEMDNIEISENITGFIYVIKAKNVQHEGTHQYRIYEETDFIDKIKIEYNDFKQYFVINNSIKIK